MSRTNGAGLESLGYSVDGITITLNTYYDEVFVDIFGPKVPFDLQYFLQDAIVEAELIYYDLTILNKWLSGIPGGALTPGIQGAAGNLVLQNSLAAGLCVQSTPAGTGLTGVEPCWNFVNCVLIDQSSQKIGTEKTIWNLKWRAIPTQQSSSSTGTVLWTTNCT